MRSLFKILGAAALACLAQNVSVASEARDSVRKRTSIPAQGLGSALQALAKERGLQVLYVTEEVDRHQTKGASGDLTSDEALSQLLSGTGLTYRYLGKNSVSIVPAAETPSADSRRSASSAASLRLVQGQSDGGQDELADNTEQPSAKTRESQESPGDEIIVTATKRTENIQDVPMSIGVVTAGDIDRRGLVNAEDYLRGLPGANQMDSQFGQSIVIRGMETSPELPSFYSGNTVATYFGETPTTTSAGLAGGSNVDLKLVDIERIEVLRGPQGTAFGSSSMGGVVRTIPVAPKLDRFEGKVAAGYSVTSGTGADNHHGQLTGNIPLIRDKLALRVVGYRYEDSGFYRNRAHSDAAFQTEVVARYGAQAFATDAEELGSNRATGGRIAALWQATEHLRFTLTYVAQETQADGIGLANRGTYEQTLLQVAPEHVVRGQRWGLFDTDIDLANAVMEYDLGWADLLATYSQVKSGSTYITSFGAYGLDQPASYRGAGNHRENVGEVRLATRLEGAWNFLAGLYAESHDDAVIYDYFWYGDPATNIYAPGVRLLGGFPDERTLDQKAAFGEVSWELLRGLTLTGGIRAYRYERALRRDTSGPFFGVRHIQSDTDTSGNILRANISYQPENGHTLLYAGWTQGFRLGNLQPGVPAGVCDTDGNGIIDGTAIPLSDTTRLNSDEVDSYELGGKFELPGRRLAVSAAAFRMNWSDVPVTVRNLTPMCRSPYLANVGAAVSEGIEVQANWAVADAWVLEFGGSWLDARITDAVIALNAPEGNRLPGSPELTANLGLQYEFAVGSYTGFLRADTIYVGPFYGNLQESPNTESGDYVKLNVSARVAVRNLAIDLFVRNLTNEDAFTFRGVGGGVGEFYGYRLRPRTVGLQLGYTF